MHEVWANFDPLTERAALEYDPNAALRRVGLLPPVEATAETMETASVQTLVRAASLGDQDAWQELVARFGGMITAIGRRYRLTPTDMGELHQTVWLRLIENFDRIRQPERIGGWLSTTARRESVRLLRRAARYTAGTDQMLANMPCLNTAELDAGPLAEERDAFVRAAWVRLKPRCRELLSMLVTDETMSYRELSILLDMRMGSIGPTRGRCLNHLRTLMLEEGFKEDADE